MCAWIHWWGEKGGVSVKCVLTVTRWTATDSRGVARSCSATCCTVVTAVTPLVICAPAECPRTHLVHNLKDNALLTGLFKCPDTLAQDLSTDWESWLASWRTYFCWLSTHAEGIRGETFALLRIRTGGNLWKALAQDHGAGTQYVCAFKECFMQQLLASCRLKALCSCSTNMREI